ncbi:GntR family transcriptional regulator [Aureimonas glaciei]|uniref:GntR family transcriptional regulator n=2 Tax=Aureimonas glaciei TaxID=1776957 RepID=A0A916XWA6_9HYPH|nr:GntR family transcriptional regulator [Aureimonas glaciei]
MTESTTLDPEQSGTSVAARRPGTAAQAKAADVRDHLEQEIAMGQRAAGERLDESEIASRFGVSRTPVREAINQLASIGMVEQIRHRGAFVRRVGIGELVEMFEVMAELEGLAGRLAARRIGAAALATLQLRLEDCRQAAARNDPDGYYYENERFHAAIYAASGNSFLQGEAARLHQRLKPFRRLQLRVAHRMRQSLREHEAIVAAIAAGDGAAAEDALRAHIVVQGERFGDLNAQLGIR